MTYKLTISRDEINENPRTDWDCNPPLYYDGGRDYGKQKFDFDFYDIVQSKKNVAIKHTKKILEVIGATQEEYKSGKEYYGSKDITDYMFDCEFDFDIESMEEVLNILGVQTYSWTSRGYSQGDSIDCLLIVTDERRKKVGCDKKDINLKGYAEIFDAWARGDVYRWSLYKIIPLFKEDGTPSIETEEEFIDGCGGYYGDDSIKGIRDEVKEYVTEEQFEYAREHIEY